MSTETIPPTAPNQVEHDAHGHDPKGFWQKYVFSTDHKIIGIQFLFSSLIWGLVGGALAMAVRHKIAWPAAETPLIGDWLFSDTGGVMNEQFYNMAFTMHASVMIFLVIIPVLAGAFGNFLIPLMIGARDMAFPTLNMLSYWVMWPAFGCFIASFYVEGGAAASGWTAYPPLSSTAMGNGQTLWVIGVILVGWSSIMGAVNYITTIITMRSPGMGFFRMPLTVWALFITAILQLLATPVLGSAMIMLLLERVGGASIFTPLVVVGGEATRVGSEGQPLLWQHLFWFYSHPAVYIMILPAMGMVSDIIATFSRKPVFGYRPMIYSISAIAGLGFIVWGHHMFQTGMNPYLGTAFMIGTMMIALPSAVKVFNWLGTLWGGRIRFTASMCFACAFVSMFIIGGLSGIYMAATPVDSQIHDTYFIVAHLHYVLFTGSLFGVFAGVYYWFPKMFGRKMDEKLGKVHFWLTFILANGTFFMMHIVGLGGMQRRIANPLAYEGLLRWEGINQFMTVCAFALFISQVVFLFNFFKSLGSGEKAGRNPWNANSLEWITPSPAQHGNFGEHLPVVHRGPYEFASPLVDDDYLPQTTELKPAT
ncbi:MAG: cbb3-type cytochrome c oxidase subunit I [Planctomycetota bacterium]|nr:cbb3-type cytochrome c oxidase subunit I [Planctomycetota bacterium]